MEQDIAMQLFSGLLWNALLICAPVMAVTLVVGVAVSIIQVITQIQDMALSFIPKLVAVVAAMVLFGPWMLRKLLLYSSGVIADIPRYFG